MDPGEAARRFAARLEEAGLPPFVSAQHDTELDLLRVSWCASRHATRAGNHPLVDGNKRLAWLATYAFLAKNGVELDPDDDAAYTFAIAVAAGEINDVGEIATVLAAWRAAGEPSAIRSSPDDPCYQAS